MTLQNVTLEAAANAFQVHPRTIVRALSGRHNTYWSEDINHDTYPIEAIAIVYNMKGAEFRRVLEGRDRLLRPDEAAKEMKIAPRTLCLRLHSLDAETAKAKVGRVYNGGVVRFLRSKVIDFALAFDLE